MTLPRRFTLLPEGLAFQPPSLAVLPGASLGEWSPCAPHLSAAAQRSQGSLRRDVGRSGYLRRLLRLDGNRRESLRLIALSSLAVPFRGRSHPSCARRRGGAGRASPPLRRPWPMGRGSGLRPPCRQEPSPRSPPPLSAPPTSQRCHPT